MIHRILLAILATLISPLSAHASVIGEQSLPAGSQLALIVAPVGKSPIFEQNASILLAPASTQKILTAIAAYHGLPKNFHYQTQIARTDNRTVIRFSGDPTFTRDDLRALLTRYRTQGGQFNGDIELQSGGFRGYEHAAGVPWDIHGICYSAAVSEIALDGNCVQGALYANAPIDSIAKATVPDFQPITLESQARIIVPNSDETDFCTLELYRNDQNAYNLKGCIEQSERVLPLRFALANPDRYIAQVIRAELNAMGIHFKGRIVSKQLDFASWKRPLHNAVIHQSMGRDALITKMLHRSDNYIADSLTKTLGQRAQNAPGDFYNGTQALRRIALNQGIDLTNAVIADGSGLSRNNRMSAAHLYRMMQYLNEPKNAPLFAMMPIGGESGTMKYRPSMVKAPLKGNVQGKTGTLYGTHNLVSVVQTQQGPMIVVQMVSGYLPNKEQQAENPSPLTRFERSFYQALIQQGAQLFVSQPKALPEKLKQTSVQAQKQMNQAL